MLQVWTFGHADKKTSAVFIFVGGINQSTSCVYILTNGDALKYFHSSGKGKAWSYIWSFLFNLSGQEREEHW